MPTHRSRCRRSPATRPAGACDRRRTVDHGESRGEHREMDHDLSLRERVSRAADRSCAGATPGRVADLVRLTDVMPTILDLLRLQLAARDDSRLVDMMRGHDGTKLEAYAESLYSERHGWAPLFSLRSGRFKFIDAPRPELNDLQLDPFEERISSGSARTSSRRCRRARARRRSVNRQPLRRTGLTTNCARAWRRWGTSLAARRRRGPASSCQIRKTAPACSNRAAASRTPTSDLWTHPGDIRIHCMTVRAEGAGPGVRFPASRRC